MAGEEVEMTDAPPVEVNENESSKPVQSIETDPKEEDDGEDDGDQIAGSDADDVDTSGRPVSTQLYKALKNITDILTNHKIKVKHRRTEEEHYPSILFRRLPNKRNLPDYYEVIKDPSAISTLKGKIQRKQYSGIPEFVHDFALIVHNAQIYNRPNSAPVRDVFRLDAIFREEMQKLVDAGLVVQEQTVYPDLGEIPYATPEPDPVEDDDDDADEDGDDDEDEDDDSDEDRRKKRGRRGRVSIGGKKQDRDEDDDNDNENEKANDAEQKRRGRPPKVDTPMEARIKAILKGLRKFKNSQGQSLIFDFEKLPDKAEHPAYYIAVQSPVALDLIKKKAKRKKYNFLEEFMQDVEKMFNNAMLYNEDGSDIYNNAKELLEGAKKLAQIEKDRPDSEYLMQDGRLPLPFIEYNGKMWRVGDWIHIQNPNDVTKPIVAQIYRTWQDPDERKWINACWYYRPEQTVHQYEKHFYAKEVVKTGQYRDHPIEEVIDKCFVMFFTRYSRGRPRGIDPSTEVYVCDSRYNEEKFKFNKIKTWASCLPDEIRDKDYEMDIFDQPKRVKKVPSPLLYTLKEDAKEDDEPQPIWGHPNAPPVMGAVHKRPRNENQSPPPEPTPPPPPTPPPAVRVPSAQLMAAQPPRPSLDRQASSSTSVMPGQIPRPSPSMTPQTPGYQNTIATPNTQFNRLPYPQATPQPSYPATQAPTPAINQSVPYVAQQQLHNGPALGTPMSGSFATPAAAAPYQRAPMPAYPAQTQLPHAYPVNVDPSFRQKEVYVLSDTANEAIPKEIRNLLPKDEQGRVLFFTQPPIDTRHIIEGKTEAEKGRPLMHTERYMKFKKIREYLSAKRKREEASLNYEPLPQGYFRQEREADGRIKSKAPAAVAKESAEETALVQARQAKRRKLEGETITKALLTFNERMKQNLLDQYELTYGEGWEPVMLRDLECQAIDQTERARKLQVVEAEEDNPKKDMTALERFRAERQDKIDQGLIKDFWTGKYLDDEDPRLPPFH